MIGIAPRVAGGVAVQVREVNGHSKSSACLGTLRQQTRGWPLLVMCAGDDEPAYGAIRVHADDNCAECQWNYEGGLARDRSRAMSSRLLNL